MVWLRLKFLRIGLSETYTSASLELIIACVLSVSATYATAKTVVNDVTPRLLTIELNGVDVRSATFLLDSLEQGVLVPAAELAAWGLTLSQPINTVL